MIKKFVIISIFMVFTTSCGFELVDTGHRGVKTYYNKVVEQSLEEGLYFYNPFSMDFIEMDVRTKRFDGEDMVYTKDIQQAKITYTLMVHPFKNKVHFLYRDYGWEWEERILPQILKGTLKNVIGRWDAVDLIENRGKATGEVEVSLREVVKDKYIEVERFEITNIDYADEFEHAVERKVVAVQAAIEARNKTVQVTEEAKQRVISAKAEAEAMRIKANALTQNKNLVEYEAALRWNGILPQYMLGNSVPFINLPK